MIAVTKEDLHRLVDELPESEHATAQRVLEGLRVLAAVGPLYTTDTAPIDDEPETEEERTAVSEAYEALARGDVISAEEAKRRLLG